MSRDREINYIGDVQRLQLAPDDILVLKVRGAVPTEMAERLRNVIREVLGEPDRKVMVLDNSVEIGVLAPASEG